MRRDAVRARRPLLAHDLARTGLILSHESVGYKRCGNLRH